MFIQSSKTTIEGLTSELTSRRQFQDRSFEEYFAITPHINLVELKLCRTTLIFKLYQMQWHALALHFEMDGRHANNRREKQPLDLPLV